ncbi:N-acetyltransferase, partial [bacterium]|nr:N-acetyltransferase [bacterium]
MKWRKNNFEIDTNRKRFDLDLIHNFLSTQSYWATGRSRATIERSIRNSVAFGIYEGKKQVGFAR